MKIGDRVIFHALTAHTCGGGECSCTPDLHCPATVVDIWPHDRDERGQELPLALVLDVEWPDDHLARHESGDLLVHSMIDHAGKPHTTTVTKHGFIGRQGHSRKSTQNPPESGSWSLGMTDTPRGI